MDYIVDGNNIRIIIEQQSKYMTDDIVDHLVMRRKKLQMTQQDIADATGIKRANVARIERKVSEVSLESLIRYAESIHMKVGLCLEPMEEEKSIDRKVNIIKDVDGKDIVFIHDLRFKRKRKIDWEEVEQFLKEYVGSYHEIADTSEKIYIGSDFPDEFTGSKDTKGLKGTSAKAKANAAQGLSEIIQIASNKSYAPNYEKKHNEDAGFGWYRYDSRFALPVYGNDGNVERYNVFSVRMLVRHDKDGKKYLYDLLRIKKETSRPFEQ